jgi:hypothetical protein
LRKKWCFLRGSKHRVWSRANASFEAASASSPKRFTKSAPQPPMDVPTTRSKLRAMGAPVSRSSTSIIVAMFRPFMPPPSRLKIRSGRLDRGAGRTEGARSWSAKSVVRSSADRTPRA